MLKRLRIVEIDDVVRMMPHSYLLTRYLVDTGVVNGNAVIGQYNSQLVENPESNLPYATHFIEYSWIETSSHTLIDPCSHYRNGRTEINLTPLQKNPCFSSSVDPTLGLEAISGCHRVSGEYFSLMQGLEQEAITRILKLDKNITMLTMTEIATLASLPIGSMMGYEKLVVKMLLKHNMKTIIPREKITLLCGA